MAAGLVCLGLAREGSLKPLLSVRSGLVFALCIDQKFGNLRSKVLSNDFVVCKCLLLISANYWWVGLSLRRLRVGLYGLVAEKAALRSGGLTSVLRGRVPLGRLVLARLSIDLEVLVRIYHLGIVRLRSHFVI